MPRTVDHAARRREIVYALWLVIHQQGIAAASLRAVAAEAGISIGRIQHYFASKEELVREGCREMVAIAQAHYGGVDDPRAELRGILAGAVPADENARIAVTVWHAYVAHVGADEVIADVVREAIEGRHRHLAALLAAARGREAATDADVTDAVRLAALGDGLVASVLVGAVTADDARRLLRDELDRSLPAGG